MAIGTIRILGKTVEAMQILRRSQSPLPKDARTLLVLIDGKRRTKQLQVLAAANGVQSFEESLAHLEQAGLIQELPEADENELELEGNAPDYSAANRITLDFSLPPGAFDERPRVATPQVRATTTPPPPNPPARSTAAPNVAVESKSPVLQEQALRAKLIEELKPKVEAELRAKLLPEVRASVQQELTAKLTEVLRPHVERQLRASLKAELKPRIEQEFRKRLETALAARLQAASPCELEESRSTDTAQSVSTASEQAAANKDEPDPAQTAQ